MILTSISAHKTSTQEDSRLNPAGDLTHNYSARYRSSIRERGRSTATLAVPHEARNLDKSPSSLPRPRNSSSQCSMKPSPSRSFRASSLGWLSPRSSSHTRPSQSSMVTALSSGSILDRCPQSSCACKQKCEGPPLIQNQLA